MTIPAAPSSYARAVARLEELGIMPTCLPELGPMQRALQRAGLVTRIPPARNIVIAGTNGKGSVAATLSRLLHSAGQRVGLYTSPHLVTTRERIRIAEQDLSEEDFAATLERLAPVVFGGEGAPKVTHFEALTLMAAHAFWSGERLPPVDWAIWEVGLGGKFDATNAIPHEPCAITRLGLDHQGILGSTLAEIAEQKFGIVPPAGHGAGAGALVVHCPLQPELEPLKARVAAWTGSRWVEAREFALRGLSKVTTPWGEASLGLLGPRAAENTSVALTLFEQLGFDPAEHLDALAHVRWPGRFSRLHVPGMPDLSCPAYLSGDHNEQGVESLLEILKLLKWQTLHLVVGIGKDKQADAMLERLATLPRAKLYLTETPFKGLELKEYPVKFARIAAGADRDVFRLLARINGSAAPDDVVIVTGSLYLAGRVLGGQPPQT